MPHASEGADGGEMDPQVQEEPWPGLEPEPEPELRNGGQQLREVPPGCAPVRWSPAGGRGWLATNPPLGFDDTALQFFPPNAPPMATFGGFGLLAHPHLWCYDSDGSLPFLPMLLVEQHMISPEQDTSAPGRRGDDPSAPASMTGATATERFGAARCVADVLETIRVAAEVWTVKRFVIVHR